MIDYKLGKIYKIISDQTDKIYIGSTTKKTLAQRMAKHRNNYKGYLKGKYHYVTSFDLLKYNDAKIILIENHPCNNKDELRSREQYWIDINKEIIINGQNAYGRNKEKVKKFEQKEEVKQYRKNWHRINNKMRLNTKILCDICYKKTDLTNLHHHKKTKKHLNCIALTKQIEETEKKYKDLIAALN